eukprot:TRINITY_DN11102_c2_g1_i1.p1 TRINITY_DN11102_c2_g1~~TRINITY_DN11102_c2_g1_i1.p1  ORF type:complete len:121 (-),score=32.30 TRINITY_DN11102_c2_g1_i1:97-459(-)
MGLRYTPNTPLQSPTPTYTKSPMKASSKSMKIWKTKEFSMKFLACMTKDSKGSNKPIDERRKPLLTSRWFNQEEKLEEDDDLAEISPKTVPLESLKNGEENSKVCFSIWAWSHGHAEERR